MISGLSSPSRCFWFGHGMHSLPRKQIVEECQVKDLLILQVKGEITCHHIYVFIQLFLSCLFQRQNAKLLSKITQCSGFVALLFCSICGLSLPLRYCVSQSLSLIFNTGQSPELLLNQLNITFMLTDFLVPL